MVFFEAEVFNLINLVFGSQLLAGTFFIMFFFILGVAFRLTGDAMIIMMAIVSVIIGNIFIPSLAIIILMIAGVAIGIFLFYRIFSK